MAEKFCMPIITFVDTAGAFPGKEAEERGQSESIASSIVSCLKVKTPILSIIIGEGGSGGAIALATADDVMMLENSIYSVISPEGCASILWKNTKYAEEAAEHRAIEERAEAAAAKEKARQESFTQAKYEKLAIVGSWWNDLSKKEKGKYIENESMVNYEKVLYGDLGAIPKSTDNFDEMFDSAKDIVVDWYMGRDAKEPPTKRRVT